MTSTVQTATPLGKPSSELPCRPATISRGPQCEVRRERTSIVFLPEAINEAHGWRTTSAFIFEFYSEMMRLSACICVNCLTHTYARS